MSDNFKNINEKLNQVNLDNEDWLQPSDALYAKISEEIYPPNKKKRFVLIFLFLISLLSLISFGIFKNSAKENFGSIEAKAIPAPTAPLIQGLSTTENNKIIAVEESDTQMDLTSSLEKNKIEVADLKINQTDYIKEFIPVNKSDSPNNNKKVNSNKSQLANSESTNNIVGSENQKSVTKGAGVLNQVENKSYLLQEQNQKSLEETNILSLVEISRLPLLQSQVDESDHIETLSPYFTLDPIDKARKDFASNLLITSSIGISTWNFKLNENYKSALQDADFKFVNGKGYQANLGIGKMIGSKFSLEFNIGYEQVTFYSGHNSPLAYQLSEEDLLQENTIDLLMATPIGFLNSSVIVSRTGTDILDETTEMIIDLNNSHSTKNLEFSLNGLIPIVKYKSFSLVGKLGIGLNYLTKVTNNLDSFTLSHNSFSSKSSSITADQNLIKKLRPFAGLGTSIQYQINNDWHIGLEYQLKSDFGSLYSENDFNTQLLRQTFQLTAKRHF